VSSIEYRPAATKTGRDAYRVRFRHAGQNRAVTFNTEEDALHWQGRLNILGAKRALELLEERDHPSVGQTLAEYVAGYVDTRTGLTTGSRLRYRNILRQHITPGFGTLLLADVNRADVARWVNGQDGSAQSVKNRHQLLSAALGHAVIEGRIPSNPAARMRMPKGERTEHVYLTVPEVDLLLDLIHPHYVPLIKLLVGTGIRWGEATALQRRDLNRPTNSARIVRAWKYTEGMPAELGAPKSDRSRRTVAVPDHVFDVIEPLVDGLQPEAFVIRSLQGRVVRTGAFHQNYWQRAAKELERQIGKKPRVHDLRHTWASWAIQEGISLPVIQRQMGHESIRITVDTYGHLARSDFDPLLTLGVGSRRLALSPDVSNPQPAAPPLA
jgi:integrase